MLEAMQIGDMDGDFPVVTGGVAHVGDDLDPGADLEGLAGPAVLSQEIAGINAEPSGQLARLRLRGLPLLARTLDVFGQFFRIIPDIPLADPLGVRFHQTLYLAIREAFIHGDRERRKCSR
jgi:hypothetical protein